MKKIMIIAILSLVTGFAQAGEDQSSALKKIINRKISFPEKLNLTEKTTVEIQVQIVENGCLEITASNGNQEVVDFIYEKLSNYKLPYNVDGNNTYSFKITFEKEHSQNNTK